MEHFAPPQCLLLLFTVVLKCVCVLSGPGRALRPPAVCRGSSGRICSGGNSCSGGDSLERKPNVQRDERRLRGAAAAPRLQEGTRIHRILSFHICIKHTLGRHERIHDIYQLYIILCFHVLLAFHLELVISLSHLSILKQIKNIDVIYLYWYYYKYLFTFELLLFIIFNS